MKYFFGCTFMNQDELKDIGVKYPIKLDYYKTKTDEENIHTEKDIKYGIEVVKTSYTDEKVDIERKTITDIMQDELKIEEILNKFKTNKVTPIAAEDVMEDLLKEWN